MISVMNDNNFTLKAEMIEDEAHSKARVSGAVNDIINTRLSNMVGSKDNGFSGGEVGDTYVNGTPRGSVKSVNTPGSEELRVSPELDKFSARNSETEQWGSRVEKVGVHSEEKRPRASDHEVDERKCGVRVSESRVGKGHVQGGKPFVSEYDTMILMFDDYAANDKVKAVGSSGNSTSVGHGYETGDMVWGKVKSHPWWPGHVYNEAFASPSVRRTKREGHVLVAFFGDSSYGWFDPAELIPFYPNYAEKSKQTNMRNFVNAVEEAVDEASRRCCLALACRCRNPHNFRSTDIQGYFVVDVGDNEPAGVYCMTQIRKSRESFRSRDTIAFVKQLALAPRGDGHSSIEFIWNKATIMAYRKALFEEFDETYAQAFGSQPVHPTREPIQAVTQPLRAPLSGPLVFAESLGKRKNSAKHNKARDQPDNDRYLFKRRDEPKELKIQQKGQTTSSMQPSHVGGSVQLANGDYVLQKRAPALSRKQQIPAKLEQMVATEMNSSSASSRVTTIQDKPVAARFCVPGSRASGSKVEQHSSFGDSYPVRQAPDCSSPLPEPNLSKSVECFQQAPNSGGKVDQTHGIDGKFHGQDSRHHMGTGGKKTKLVKHPVGESVSEKSALGEKKKKREKELGTEMSMQKRDFCGKDHPLSLTEDFLIEQQKKDDGDSSSLFHDSLRLPPSTVGIGNLELKLSQLLNGLHALALNPFHAMERNGPAIVRQAFLNFRSHVYQKSLTISSSSQMEPKEVPPPVNVKDLPSPGKPLVRPHDPTKGVRKRVPSDRQEEMGAKRLKKINDIKSLTIEKKTAERNVELHRDGKETVGSGPRKWFKPDSVLKKESLGKRREPSILVMKFPPNTTLPSGFELKARLARFGPLDHSHTRIFWKTSQIRVVFVYRSDAEAAHRHLVGKNTLFGNVDIRCSIRPLEASAPESETKVQREDGLVETPQLRDSGVEQRQAAAVQLKSCLKKPLGDEASAVAVGGGNGFGGGGNGGGGRGTPRVKFMLGGGESSSAGEQVMASNNYNINEAAAVAAGGGGRGSPRVKFMLGGGGNLMDTNRNTLNSASFADGGGSSSVSYGMDFSSRNFQKGILPPLLPQFQIAPSNLRYAETTLRTNNFHSMPSSKNVDIEHEMLTLLTKCNDVVTNLVCNLGYLPYRPL